MTDLNDKQAAFSTWRTQKDALKQRLATPWDMVLRQFVANLKRIQSYQRESIPDEARNYMATLMQEHGEIFANESAHALSSIYTLRDWLSKKLDDAGDTLDDYLRLAGDLGFEQIGVFKPASLLKAAETILCHARPDGLFLTIDTYKGRLNSANLTFEWMSHDKLRLHPPCGSLYHCPGGSGGTYDVNVDTVVYSGTLNVASSLRLPLEKLEQTGCFVSPFMARDSKRFLLGRIDYDQEIPSGDYTTLQNDRLRQMPLWVRQIAGVAASLAPVTPETQKLLRADTALASAILK